MAEEKIMSKVAEMEMERTMKSPSITLNLKVSKEKFVADDGKTINYYAYSIEIADETFRLQPKPDDKRMLSYLLNDLFDNVGKDEETKI